MCIRGGGWIGLCSKHAIEREYVAIALGAIAAPMRIETLHGRDPHDRKKFTSRVREGKVAITHVEPVRRLGLATLVRCTRSRSGPSRRIC